MRVIVLLACAMACVLSANGASVRVCENDQLTVTIEGAGVGMSHWAEALQFLNKSPTACQLVGVPDIDLLTADRRRFPIPVCPNCGAYFFPRYPIRPVVLKPGESAHALMSSTTGYDNPLCSATEYVRIALPPGKSTFLLASRSYACVSLNVSPYLAGSYRGVEARSDESQYFTPTAWGKPVHGVELSLTPFAPEQKAGYLGFQVFVRGMNNLDSLPVLNCDTATFRIWRGDHLIRKISSSNPLTCVVATPPVKPFPSMSGTGLTTAFFDTTIDEPGDYSFDLVERFRGDATITLISNRTAVHVLSEK